MVHNKVSIVLAAAAVAAFTASANAQTKPRHRLLRTYRLERSEGKLDAIGVTLANEVGQDLCRGIVDLDDARRCQDQ